MEKQKLKVVVITYNISSLLTLQVKCFEKFCQDDFEILVVDNSSDMKVAEDIKYFASISNCEYIKTNASSLNGSSSHSFAANLSYLRVKDFDGIIMYIDQDCFPMHEFSAYEILGEKIIAGIGQARGHLKYMWPGCLLINNKLVEKEMVDFSPNILHNMDTGGNLYKLIEKVGDDQCVFFNEAYHQNPNFTKSFYNFYSGIHNNLFYHFVNSSNWNKSNDHEERINSLINIIKEKTGIE